MATVTVDYVTFKSLVSTLAGVSVFYAPVNGKTGFQALAVTSAVAVLYNGDDPGSFALDFPTATKVANVYL